MIYWIFIEKLKDKIIPKAVLYFTGELDDMDEEDYDDGEDYDDEDEDDEDDDENEDDEDDDEDDDGKIFIGMNLKFSGFFKTN